MKRFTLTLAAIIGFAAAVNAQTYVGDLEGSLITTIPSEFTTNGHPFVVFRNQLEQFNLNIYQSDFTTQVTGINTNRNFYIISYNNYDVSQSGFSLCFTQNLFNSDEHFEYIEVEGEYVEYGDFTSIHIKSTNGNTLWSFYAEDGYNISEYGFNVFKLENQYYLIFEEYKAADEYYEWEDRIHLYLISQTDGLTKVDAELPISVFPTMPTREQQITVELGEGNNAKEITVVNSLGQVVKRVPVQEGQRQITIPVQGLNSGLNVVNTRTEQGQGSCKIIVR